MKTKQLLLFSASLFLLSGCSYRFTQTVCNAAILPYTLTVATVHNTGENAEFVEFSRDKDQCAKSKKDEIAAFYKQMKREQPYQILKAKYADTKLASSNMIEKSLNSAILGNAIGPDGLLREYSKRTETYTDGGKGKYKYADAIKMFEYVEKEGWNKKYTAQYKSILNQCLSQKYSDKELARLYKLEFDEMWLPKTACVFF